MTSKVTQRVLDRKLLREPAERVQKAIYSKANPRYKYWGFGLA